MALEGRQGRAGSPTESRRGRYSNVEADIGSGYRERRARFEDVHGGDNAFAQHVVSRYVVTWILVHAAVRQNATF